ncbi:MAG: DUF3570 domain-containing protein [Epsilonproteobacteria bacterium]|nr:DUF3570 domain-containing protein [Campylobacterota bacterium]
MQLRKLSVIACALLALNVHAEDYISVQYVSYDEDSGRTTIDTPSIEINKDFGADYTLNLSYVHDTVSGASPTYYDASSGASAKIPDGALYKDDIKYDNIPYKDKREAFSASLTKRFASRDELSLGWNYSDENDYTSREFSLQYLHYLDRSKNSSLTFGYSHQSNKVGIECSLGNSICDTYTGASAIHKNLQVNTYEIGFTQIIDKTSLAKASIFYIGENGYLSNPYMRVVRDYNTNPKITEESKPGERDAYGFTVNYTKALRSNLSTINDYRFYHDDWGITSHTLSTELQYEWNDKLTTGIGFRYYTQSEADFFSPYIDYFTDQKYASSDRRMSDFDSYAYKLVIDYKITDKIRLNSSINYYDQPKWLDAVYYSVGVKYLF